MKGGKKKASVKKIPKGRTKVITKLKDKGGGKKKASVKKIPKGRTKVTMKLKDKGGGKKKAAVKKIPKGRTKVTTKLKDASIIEKKLLEYNAFRAKKNSNQDAYRQRQKEKKADEDRKMTPKEAEKVALRGKVDKKEYNRVAQDKRVAHLGRMRMVPVEDVRMVGALLVDPVPNYLMIQMLTHCYSEDFKREYNSGKRSIDLPRHADFGRIDAAGDPVATNSGADYYMLNWMKSKASVSAELWDHAWENNSVMSVSGMYLLDSFGAMLISTLKEALESSDEFTFHPGFVSTKGAAHQELHVDSPLAYKVAASKQNYILHMPLSVEGLTLRIANVEDGVEKCIKRALGRRNSSAKLPSSKKSVSVHDFFYHVPFGSALLLPERQWHSGHYGEVGNLRFHAVLRRDLMETSKLLLLEPVLSKQFPNATIEYDMKLSKIEAEAVVSNSRTSMSKAQTSRYIRKLTELMPGKLFLNCFPGFKC
jgi:hypothetical protein